jgi:hypothetical protein
VNPDGTRIQIRLSYNPPGGALAHDVLALFGADPKSRLDEEDLVRIKTALETGPRPYDAARADRVLFSKEQRICRAPLENSFGALELAASSR